MKMIKWLGIFIVVISICSCTKEKEDDKENYSTEIVGEWTWLSSRGGITGTALYTPENTNTTEKIIFKADNSFIKIRNSDTILKASYFESKKKTIFSNEERNCVTITDFMIYVIGFKNDTLTLDENVYDGFGHEYLRVK